MAQEANTYDTQDANGLREGLDRYNPEYRTNRDPFLLAHCRQGAKTKKPPSMNGRRMIWLQLMAKMRSDEGDEYSFEDPDATVRVANHTQIMRKGIVISETLEAVEKAGRKSEMAYQTAKKSKELKRDLEKITLSNQASSIVGK